MYRIKNLKIGFGQMREIATELVLVALFILGFMHVGIPLIYLLWMRHIASTRPWNVRGDPSYTPRVTVVLPTYNEEKVILARLQNLLAVDYPKKQMEIIVVDGASNDDTVPLVKAFADQHPEVSMRIIEEGRRRGKTRAMNRALQAAEGEVIVTTDADTYWATDALRVLLSYLADPSVGAVTGTKVPLNPSQCSAVGSEVAYHVAYDPMKVGQSKIHSTLGLQGELTAYKRLVLDKFDETSGSDDMASAISIAQKGFRCLQVPEAKTYHHLYHTWRGNTTVKVRRAQQMVCLWLRCLRLTLRGKLKLPPSIIIPQLYLHLLNPFVGVLFYTVVILAILRYPIFALSIFIFVVLPLTRKYLFSFTAHNLFLLMGFFRHVMGERQVVWRKIQETRVVPLNPVPPRTSRSDA